jgi:hypothetical protein
MSSQRIFQLAAFALIVGGALGIVGVNLPVPRGVPLREVVASPYYFPATFLPWLGALLIALGLPWVYARQASRSGKLGFVGFVVMMTGLLLVDVGTGALRAFVAPWIVTLDLSDASIASGPPLPYVFVALVAGLPASIAFGVATYRAAILPRWAALTFLIAQPLGLVAEFSRKALPDPIHNLGDDVFRLTVVVLGVALWMSVRDPGAVATGTPSLSRAVAATD